MAAGYQRGCVGKNLHPTKDQAQIARRSIARAKGWRLDQTAIYRCTQGPHWHVRGPRRNTRGERKR